MKRIIVYISALAILTTVTSCTLWDQPDYQAAVRDMLLMTAIAENEVNIQGRATLPLHDTSIFPTALNVSTLTTVGSSLSGTLVNYPEAGQDTAYTVTAQASNIYFVQTVTSYRTNSNREITYEDYYLKDIEPNNTLTVADPVTNAAGTPDPLFRQRFETRFALLGLGGARSVPSTRIESIQDTTTKTAGLRYASFKDSPMVYDAGFTPASNGSASYSSQVSYTQTVKTQQIGVSVYLGNNVDLVMEGVRYYTEILQGDGATEVSAFYQETWKDGSTVVAHTVGKYYYTVFANGTRGAKTVDGRSTIFSMDGPVNFTLSQ